MYLFSILGETDASGTYKMEKRSQETSKVLKFFDGVFDSLNGGTFKSPPGKPLKGAVTKNSAHVSFWQNSAQEMKRMYFRKEGTHEKFVPPSLKNFILTIEGFIDLKELIFSRNIKYFHARSFNQDPLENYFGQIRQHRGRNINPTCEQFRDSYKSLLIRNIASHHSVSANCEETFETTLFQLEDLLKSGSCIGSNFDSANSDFGNGHLNLNIRISKITDEYFQRPLSKVAMGYVAGFVAKKVLQKFNCEFCKIHILTNERTESNFSILITEKEYGDNPSLTYCNDVFVKCINKVYNICKFIISNYRFKDNVKSFVYTYVKKYVHFSFICEHKEKITDFIMCYVIDLCIFIFCKSINSLITGKATDTNKNSCSLFKNAVQINLKRKR